jgi:hypothetical protein
MWIIALSIVFLASLISPLEAQNNSEVMPPGLEVTVSVDQPEVFTRFSRNDFKPPTIRMILRVYNSSDRPITLPFASGQEFDFMIFDENNQLVWRWSEGKFFIMILTELTLAPGESKTFDASRVFVDKEGEPMPEGVYTVMGKLAVPNRKIQENVQFSHRHVH